MTKRGTMKTFRKLPCACFVMDNACGFRQSYIPRGTFAILELLIMLAISPRTELLQLLPPSLLLPKSCRDSWVIDSNSGERAFTATSSKKSIPYGLGDRLS